jgi:hypothetical protein
MSPVASPISRKAASRLLMRFILRRLARLIGAALLGLRIRQESRQFLNSPNVFCKSSFHCRGQTDPLPQSPITGCLVYSVSNDAGELTALFQQLVDEFPLGVATIDVSPATKRRPAVMRLRPANPAAADRS